MITKEGFAEHVADAYDHLYDLVYLRTHPLIELLYLPDTLPVKKRARELHDLLRNFIDELDPGSQAPYLSPEWRRHRYMVLRYIKGLNHQAVADQFGVSLRQYYRIRKTIMEDVSDVLWNRYIAQGSPRDENSEIIQDHLAASRLELLRLEGGKLTQSDTYTHIGKVIEGVHSLLQDVLSQREIDFQYSLPAPLPTVSVSQDMLRQTLLGILGYLIGRVQQASIRLTLTREKRAMVVMSLLVEPSEAVQEIDQGQAQEHLEEIQEMAVLSNCHVMPVYDGPLIVGFELQLPVARRTVLVIDDNEDMLQLFHAYLSPHGYHVITAQSAPEAIEKVHEFQPYAVTLDLMMPEHDGWGILQTLLANSSTNNIPVIVCSVLKQKELALSLGATAYLEKPITEQSLLLALEGI